MIWSDYFLLESFLSAEAFAFSVFFGVAAELLLLLVVELTPVDFDCLDALFVLAFCPEEGLVTDLLVTVVVDLLVVPVLCSAGGFVTDFLVTVVDDLLVVPVLFSTGAFVPDLLVTAVFDLRVVLFTLPDDLLSVAVRVLVLLTELLTGVLSADLLLGP
jgi:hypothetical protein